MTPSSYPTTPSQPQPTVVGPQPTPKYENAAGKGGRDRRNRGAKKPPLRRAAAPSPAKSVRIPRRELLSVTSQLAIMTRAGVDLAGCLQALARQSKRPATRAMLEQVHEDVLGGNALSEAMRRYSRVFGDTFVASIAAGEASGRLTEVLNQLVRLQRSELRLRNSLRTILAYPVLLTAVSLLVIAGLVLFVLPSFAGVFEQYDMPLPALTQCLLDVSSELRARFWLWGGLGLAAIAGLTTMRYSASGRRFWDGLALNMILVRDVTRALLIGRTCRLMGIMIDSGVPLLECLRLARYAAQNSYYRDLFRRLEKDVTNGRGMSDGMLSADFVPSAAAEMLVTAERTGALSMVTELIGQHYEEEGEARLRELVTILEPMIIVVMGVVVAAVVLSVMLPMFDMATFAQKAS